MKPLPLEPTAFTDARGALKGASLLLSRRGPGSEPQAKKA